MSDTKTAEEFREEQLQTAREQALTGDNAVPEQRPQAFNQPDPEAESELFKRRQEAGDFDPPDKKAYDTAGSDAQLKKAEKAEKKIGPETLTEGAVVRVTKKGHMYEGAMGVIIKVTYKNADEAAKAASGVPGAARFAKASDYLVRSRGGAHALFTVTPDEIEYVPNGFTHRESDI